MPGVAESRTWDALLTTTLANYSEKLRDQIFDEYPLLSWFNGKLAGAMKREKLLKTVAGGESIVEHLLYEMNSTVKSYSGFETLDLTAQEGMTIGRFSWRQYAGGVSISGIEKRNNKGDKAMINLLEAKTTQCENSMRDRMSRDCYGANADGKSLDGLGTILSTTATLGGLSPTTFTWWQPTSTASGSFAAQGLKDMRTLFNTLSFGNVTPDGLFTTQAIFEFFETSLQPQERYSNIDAANTGFTNLTFKGKPIFFDRDCTSGQVVMLNSRAIKFCVHEDANMEMTKFVQPDDQDAWSAKYIWQGNLVVNERRKHGRLTAVTA